jgi:hypothetical protein
MRCVLPRMMTAVFVFTFLFPSRTKDKETHMEQVWHSGFEGGYV